MFVLSDFLIGVAASVAGGFIVFAVTMPRSERKAKRRPRDKSRR
jgi:uncharacterized membrane protein YccC